MRCHCGDQSMWWWLFFGCCSGARCGCGDGGHGWDGLGAGGCRVSVGHAVAGRRCSGRGAFGYCGGCQRWRDGLGGGCRGADRREHSGTVVLVVVVVMPLLLVVVAKVMINTVVLVVVKEYILVREQTASQCVFQTFAHPTSPPGPP